MPGYTSQIENPSPLGPIVTETGGRGASPGGRDSSERKPRDVFTGTDDGAPKAGCEG